MSRHVVDMKAKARVPFERTREFACKRFDLGVAKAGVEHQRLHVGGKAHGAMNMRFNVVVEAVPFFSCGEVDETHSRRRTERGRLEAGVGKTECASRRDFRPKPQMGGAESRGRSGGAATKVERAHFRTLVGGRGVIGATEKPSLPLPAIATWKCREASIAGAGLKLRAVLAIDRQSPKQRDASVESGGMKVDRYPYGGIKRTAVAARCHVFESTLLRRIRRRKPGVRVHEYDGGRMVQLTSSFAAAAFIECRWAVAPCRKVRQSVAAHLLHEPGRRHELP